MCKLNYPTALYSNFWICDIAFKHHLIFFINLWCFLNPFVKCRLLLCLNFLLEIKLDDFHIHAVGVYSYFQQELYLHVNPWVKIINDWVHYIVQTFDCIYLLSGVLSVAIPDCNGKLSFCKHYGILFLFSLSGASAWTWSHQSKSSKFHAESLLINVIALQRLRRIHGLWKTMVPNTMVF